MKRKALISVSNKEGIIEFAANLEKFNYQIYSTGGTAKILKENGVNVTLVSDVTGFPEIMNGRVKTLHPKIHGGILADRENEGHIEEAKKHNISMIDMVVVNLYPFEETLKKADSTYMDKIENIDIGGPTMIRSSAKNSKYLSVVTDSQDYKKIIEELEENNEISQKTKNYLAGKAFVHTANYDRMIANFFNELNEITSPDYLQISMKKKHDLRYGENPHQKATFYENEDDKLIEKLHGKQLSYNNYLDIDGALKIIQKFINDENPVCAIMKHTNPCGIGTDSKMVEAYKKAFATDTMSPFGGIVVLNKKLDLETAIEINKIFTEIIIAPDFSEDALKKLKKKKNRRLLKYTFESLNKMADQKLTYSCMNGILSQEIDMNMDNQDDWEVVTERKPTGSEMKGMIFGWKTVALLKSNAICFTKDDRTIGLGMGQPSRIDSTEIAVSKSKKFGLSLDDAICASDAFFPFRDSIDEIAKLGIKAVIQPGGSIRDKEVIEACNEHGIAMIFTKTRHFRH